MFNQQSGKISFPLDASGEAVDFSLLANFKDKTSQHEAEGQLAVDVAQTDDELIVVAAMAGTPPESIQLHLHNDLLTIRGERKSPLNESSEHFYQECYWGKFSRSIVLPVDVKAELVRAEYNNGILVITLPKANPQNNIPIMVIEE